MEELKKLNFHALQGNRVDQSTLDLENDEIRTVVMGTMLLQLSMKMFLTLTDEILHFHSLIISDNQHAGIHCPCMTWPVHRSLFINMNSSFDILYHCVILILYFNLGSFGRAVLSVDISSK